MGNVGNKFVPGIVDCLDARQHLVEGIRDLFRLRIIRDGNPLLLVSVRHVLNGSRDRAERLDKNARQEIPDDKDQKADDDNDQQSFIFKDADILIDFIRRHRSQHDAFDDLGIRILDRHDNLDVIVVAVIERRSAVAVRAGNDVP